MDEIVKAALKKWPNVPDCRGWLALDARESDLRGRGSADVPAREPGEEEERGGSQGRARWLWVERDAAVSHWDALRRAVYSRANTTGASHGGPPAA